MTRAKAMGSETARRGKVRKGAGKVRKGAGKLVPHRRERSGFPDSPPAPPDQD